MMMMVGLHKVGMQQPDKKTVWKLDSIVRFVHLDLPIGAP